MDAQVNTYIYIHHMYTYVYICICTVYLHTYINMRAYFIFDSFSKLCGLNTCFFLLCSVWNSKFCIILLDWFLDAPGWYDARCGLVDWDPFRKTEASLKAKVRRCEANEFLPTLCVKKKSCVRGWPFRMAGRKDWSFFFCFLILDMF